jgi:hypothetical protein
MINCVSLSIFLSYLSFLAFEGQEFSGPSGTVGETYDEVRARISNVFGAQESIPRNESASLCSLAGRYDNPIPTRFLDPIDCLKISAESP